MIWQVKMMIMYHICGFLIHIHVTKGDMGEVTMTPTFRLQTGKGAGGELMKITLKI